MAFLQPVYRFMVVAIGAALPCHCYQISDLSFWKPFQKRSGNRPDGVISFL